MKLFSALFLLLSINAFAQYNDGFHAEPEIKCTTGECLMVEDRPIEMIEMIDREGYPYSKVRMVMVPPNTTAVTVPISFAVNPLSKAPSSLDDPTNIVFTDATLPRIWSGVFI